MSKPPMQARLASPRTIDITPITRLREVVRTLAQTRLGITFFSANTAVEQITTDRNARLKTNDNFLLIVFPSVRSSSLNVRRVRNDGYDIVALVEKQVTRTTFFLTAYPARASKDLVLPTERTRILRAGVNSDRRIVDMDTKEKMNCAESATNGYKKEDVKEVQIPVPWGHIRGQWWGPADKQPIVAIHGWQDNSGTFDSLAELLPNVAILSIDLPGHGFSSHLPLGQFYYVFWDGVLALRRIVKYYKWNKVKLLGHSLGGAISFLYAASYPDEVDVLICLDIASPSVRDVKKTAAVTGEHIDRFLKYELLTLDNAPCYEYNEMLDIVEEAYDGSITREGAEILMRRGMQPAYKQNKYYFSRDPKLKVSLLGILSLDLVLEYASQIKCAYLNIRANPGMKFEQPENYEKVLDIIKLGARNFEYHEVKGTHHVHLTEPEKIAPIIKNFLQN